MKNKNQSTQNDTVTIVKACDWFDLNAEIKVVRYMDIYIPIWIGCGSYGACDIIKKTVLI